MYPRYLNENGNSKSGNQSYMVTKKMHGDDLNETNKFNVWKLIIHGYNHLHGDDLNEN